MRSPPPLLHLDFIWLSNHSHLLLVGGGIAICLNFKVLTLIAVHWTAALNQLSADNSFKLKLNFHLLANIYKTILGSQFGVCVVKLDCPSLIASPPRFGLHWSLCSPSIRPACLLMSNRLLYFGTLFCSTTPVMALSSRRFVFFSTLWLSIQTDQILCADSDCLSVWSCY